MDMQELDSLTNIPPNRFLDYGLDPADPPVVSGNTDHDPFTTFQEWQADTNPTNEHSYFYVDFISPGPPVSVHFQSSSNRVYTLRSATNVAAGGWSDVPGQVDIPGSGGLDALSDANAAPAKFYKVGVRVPE